jgi:hypothetical protein
MKRFIGWCALAVVIGAGRQASAQTPEEAAAVPVGAPAIGEPAAAPTVGDPGHWSISLERAFGFDYAKETQSMGGIDQQTGSATSFSLFSNPLSQLLSAFSFPRAGFDVFLAPGLSLGTSLGVFHGSQSATPTGGTESTQSFTGVVVTPRIGYVAHLAPSVSFWPRAGISIIYVTSSANGGTDVSESSHLIAGTVEAPLVFTIAPRVAFTFGPTFDISFSGGHSDTITGYPTTTIDEKVLEIGAQAGLVVTL